MFNKAKGSTRTLRRMLALLMVLMFATTSMPVFGLDVWDDQPNNGNDIYFASSEESDNSEFDNEANDEANDGDGYVADEPGYDYGYDNGYNDENSEADYGYEADYDYKDEDEYESEEYGYEEKEVVAATVTIIFEEDTLFVEQGSSFDLLEGVSAVDQDGENINVFVHDSGGFDINAEWPYNGFTITYAAIHPVSEAFFTAQRTVYVTMAIVPLGTDPDWLRLNNAVNDTSAPSRIIIHPAGTNGGVDWTAGDTFNLVIQDTDRPDDNTIVTVRIPDRDVSWALSWNMLHTIFLRRDVAIEAAHGEDIVLRIASIENVGETIVEDMGRFFLVEDGGSGWNVPSNVVLGSPTGGTLILDGGADTNPGVRGGVVVDSNLSSLTLRDGVVITNGRNEGGGGVFIRGNSTVIMEGGQITNNTAPDGGGVAVWFNSNFIMRGGEISGNTATGGWGGGGVSVNVSSSIWNHVDSADFTMEGGRITGNTANSGGGVHVNVNSTLTMTGGEITDNTATGNGGGVFMAQARYSQGATSFRGTSSVMVNGGTISGNIANNGGGIFIVAAEDRSSSDHFGVSNTAVLRSNVARNGAFNHGIENTGTAGAGLFPDILWAGNNSIPGTHLLNNFDVNYNNNPLVVRTVTFNAQGGTLTPPPQTVLNNGFAAVPNPAPELTNHTLVGWRLSGVTTNFDFANTPITSDITLYAEWEQTGGTTERDWVRLNNAIQNPDVARVIIHPAHSISGVTEGRVGNVFNLVIQDTDQSVGIVTVPITGAVHTINVNRAVTVEAAAGFGVISLEMRAEGASGRHFNVTAAGNLTIDSGAGSTFIIVGNANTTSGSRGGVSVHGGTFNQNGNSIIQNNRNNMGGGVLVADGGTFNMAGESSVLSNHGVFLGGGVHAENGSTVNMAGGGIAHNEALNGGGVWGTNSEFNMSGGTISDNEAHRGGGVAVSGENSTFVMHDGTISANITPDPDSWGGGVYVTNQATFTMHDGEISGHTSLWGGSAVFIRGMFQQTYTQFIMNGGIINGNIAGDNTHSAGDGTVSVWGNMASFEMNGGEISGNTSRWGGGVDVSAGTFIMNDGEISGNIARLDGGGVSVVPHTQNGVSYYGSFVMNGGVIADNTARGDISGLGFGGGVSLSGGTTFEMHDGIISDNEATSNGGGVSVAWNSEFTMDGGTISGNGATRGGGVVVRGVGSTFEMHDGTISANIITVPSGLAGGVYVTNEATFIMHDGEISGHTSLWGGSAVGIWSTVTAQQTYTQFIMNGGIINGNIAGDNTHSAGGGTVLVWGNMASFEMNGGEISGNTSRFGGGVDVSAGTFVMNDGEISGNIARLDGGGVNVAPHTTNGVNYYGSFVMNGGVIADNTARGDILGRGFGGGVSLSGGTTFEMHDGIISDNEATNGGGVSVAWNSEFTMDGGTISGNEATNGGGVAVRSNATFTATAGSITGNHAEYDGGGIFATDYADVRTLPIGAYDSLTISEDVVFSGNTAGNGAFLPPTNPEITDIAVPAIGNGPSAGVPGLLTNSVQRHTLNNFDINFSYERPEVSITKVAPATTTPNAALTYTLTIQNTGNVTLTDLDVTDTLPTQLTNPRNLQYPAGVTAGFTGQTLDATITSLAPNASVTITFVATVNASVGTTITNTATVNVPSMTGVNAQSTAITTVQSSGGNGPTEPEMTKLPDRLTANVGGTISWTLQGFHNRSGNAVTDFTVIDTPGRGLNFSSGRLPAFTGGAGITYEIRYRVDGSNVWHVHATGIDASSAHNFSLPQPGNLHYTEIGFFFGDVPANFGLNNEIVMTFRVGADAPNNQLINRFLVSYNNTERQGGGPNDPVVVPPGGSVGGGGGGTIIENPRVALEEFFSPYHNSFLIGAPGGTIRPHGNITRAEVTTVLFRLLDDNFRAARWSQQNQFSDVHTNQWFNNAVSTMANANIVNGNPDGTFRPNDSITRAEFAAMLARFFDGVTPTGQNTFTDTSGHWAENYINMLADFGWVQGDGSGRFNPNGQMTRAEAAAIVNRMLDRVLGSTDDLLDGRTLWPDTPNQNAWYYLYMQEASHSTEFERRANSTLRWTEILPHLDWSVLERPQSRPGDITTAREQQRN